MKPRLNLVRLFALGMTGLTWAGISDAAALDYPTRPVRWVVGYPAGGSTDILARLIGQYLSEKLGQQFIVENKPGAGNNIATEAVINAPPDGYTLLFVNPANGINASLYKKLSFNFVARYRADRRHHARSQCDGGQPQRAGQNGGRIHRLRQGQSEQGQPGVVRQRHVGPPLGRTVHGDDRGEADPRALPRLRASAHRHDRRTGAGAVRQPAVFDPARQRRASCAHSR